jgi:phosphoenolpyruvate carboxykinase (ATP)
MIASKVPELDDLEIIQPRKLYERTERMDEYNDMVAKLKSERLEYFKKYPKLNASITEVFG